MSRDSYLILSEETVAGLGILGYREGFNHKTGNFGWIYPDGTFHVDCPTAAVQIAIENRVKTDKEQLRQEGVIL